MDKKSRRRRKMKASGSLSNVDRQKICEMYLSGQKLIKISEMYSVHKSTITRVIQRFIDTDSHKSKPKGGRVNHKKLQDDQFELVAAFYKSAKESPTLREVRTFCEEQFSVQLSVGTAFNTIQKVKRRLQEEEEQKGSYDVEIDEVMIEEEVADEGEYSLYIVTD